VGMNNLELFILGAAFTGGATVVALIFRKVAAPA